MNTIFELIRAERERQDKKWGSQRHLPNYTWSAILTEENGEVAKATLEKDTANLKEELVQVAAVAVAWLEALEA